MTKKLNFMVVLVLLVGLLLSGCGGNDTDPNAEPTKRGDAFQEDPTEAPVVEDETEGGEEVEVVPTEPQLVGGVEVDADGVPVDVPIPPGVYKLKVSNKASNIEYEIDGGLQAVADFYAEEMAVLGWSTTNSPDTVVGAMGTLIRVNEIGDTWSLNMSYNQNGDYVTVYITLLRAK